MKRKAFHMSGGKDRKAQKDKFVFTVSDEEDNLTETVTEKTIPDADISEPVADIQHETEPLSDIVQESEVEKSYPEEIQEAVMTASKAFETTECVPSESQTIASEDAPPSPPISPDEPEKIQAEQPKEYEEVAILEKQKLPDHNAQLPTFYNGPNLADIRKRCGINLTEIWEATKIPIATLENVEAENYETLPPEVYVRSFIATYAKYLSLDPKKAMKDYMERYHIWKTDYDKQQKRKSSLFSFGKSGSFFGIRFKKS